MYLHLGSLGGKLQANTTYIECLGIRLGMIQGGPRADPYKWSEMGPLMQWHYKWVTGVFKKLILLIGPITPFIHGHRAHRVGYNGFVLCYKSQR